MYLFFDVETDGLPINYKAKTEDIDNWPLIVQLAWALYDENKYLVSSRSSIIGHLNEFIGDAIDVNGITKDMMDSHGSFMYREMQFFHNACVESKYIIAHNINFDIKVLGAEHIRANQVIPFDGLEKICTMLKSTKFCELPGKYGFKWPKLQELHKKLFEKEYESDHNAMIDVFATAKCFFELKELNVI